MSEKETKQNPAQENISNTKKAKKPKVKKPFRWDNFFATCMVVVLSLGIVVGIASFLYLKHCIDTAPTFNINDFENTESTKVLDVEGNVIADIGTVNRENVSYDDIPQAFIDAIISVEDSRFFVHNGFDLPRFIKSIFENIKTMSFSQGASTITMQLVRNVYFTNDETQKSRERSIRYKIQQIYLSLLAEQQLNKKRILELYVNRINFGASTSRGIKGAAEYYFGKDVNELSLGECAYLAGVINAPSANNAYRYYTRSEARRNVVLNLMAQHGYITEEEAAIAKSIDLADQLSGGFQKSNAYQAYINEVVDEAMALTGKDPYTTTMTIYTFMRKDVQEAIEAIEAGETKIEWPDELMQTAIVSMDNRTGAIVGVGGGRGDIVAKGFSRVSDMKKQPGSSVKPFLSYALAFEYLGYSTKHTLKDEPINYRGTNILISNFNGTYKGEVLLDYAVGVSLNVPAYNTLYDVVQTATTKTVVEYLNNLGFDQVTTDNFDLGYAIGGSTFEVTVTQMAAAHGAMVNGGNYVKPHTIERIEFADGSEPYVPTYVPNRVISEEAAYLATWLMEQNVSTNYGNFMQLLKRKYETYAKTGTTNYDDSFVSYGIPNGAAKDKWMICSSSEYTTAVWIGYDKAVDGEDTFISGKKSALNIPGNINSMLLDVLHAGHRPKNVSQPKGVSEITFVKGLDESVAPIEGMAEDYIVTGLINSQNYPTQTPLTAPTVASLNSFTSSLVAIKDGKAVIDVAWAPYPDPAQMIYSDGTYETVINTKKGGKKMELHNIGTKLFDPSWVFGIVQYNANVGGINISSGTNTARVEVAIPANGEIVCSGSYGYTTGIANSNVITNVVQVNVDISSLTTISQASDANTQYGLNWTMSPVQVQTPEQKAMENQIISIYIDPETKEDIRMKNLPLSQMSGATVEYWYDEPLSFEISWSMLNQLKEYYGLNWNFMNAVTDVEENNGKIVITDTSNQPYTLSTDTTVYGLRITPALNITRYTYQAPDPVIQCNVSTVAELRVWCAENEVDLNVQEGILEDTLLSELVVSPALKASYKKSELPALITVTLPNSEPGA